MNNCGICNRISSGISLSDVHLSQWIPINLLIKVDGSSKLCNHCISDIKLCTSYVASSDLLYTTNHDKLRDKSESSSHRADGSQCDTLDPRYLCNHCTATFNSKLLLEWHLQHSHIYNNVVYIHDKKLIRQCNKIPNVNGRASMVHALIKSYDLLSHLNIVSSKPVSYATLCLSHDKSYIDFLRIASNKENLIEEQIDKFGLAYDCPIVKQMYNFIRTIAGASYEGAKCLNEGYKYAINWSGGWHHALRSESQGFCYVNDIVIAIRKLLQKFPRVLYIDLDVHHGNGVEAAFSDDSRVLTLSFHLYEPGFYPGTGSLEDVGSEKAKYYTVNVPLLSGLSDKNLTLVFSHVCDKVIETFGPNVIVVQCGADSLNKDPLGGFACTLKGIGECVQRVLRYSLPVLFLGGGGYMFANAARLWTYLTSIIIGKSISNDIPGHKYFMDYGHGYGYELHISPGQREDLNTSEYLNNIISSVLNNLDNLKH